MAVFFQYACDWFWKLSHRAFSGAFYWRYPENYNGPDEYSAALIFLFRLSGIGEQRICEFLI